MQLPLQAGSRPASRRLSTAQEWISAGLSVLTFVMLCIVALVLDGLDTKLEAGMLATTAKIDAGLEMITPPSLVQLAEDLLWDNAATGKRSAETLSAIAKKASAVDWTTVACFPICTQWVMKPYHDSYWKNYMSNRAPMSTPAWDWNMLSKCSRWTAVADCKDQLLPLDQLLASPSSMSGKGFGLVVPAKFSKDMSKYLTALSQHIDMNLHALDGLKQRSMLQPEVDGDRGVTASGDTISLADPFGTLCTVAKAYTEGQPFIDAFRSTFTKAFNALDCPHGTSEGTLSRRHCTEHGFQVTWNDNVTWMVDDTVDTLFDTLYQKAQAGGVC